MQMPGGGSVPPGGMLMLQIDRCITADVPCKECIVDPDIAQFKWEDPGHKMRLAVVFRSSVPHKDR